MKYSRHGTILASIYTKTKEERMTAMKAKKTKKTVEFDTDENTLALYLREIGRIPLMTREEEDEAARAAARGDMAARSRLVNANLRFVVTVAKRYQGKGIPLADLVSEGNIGLLQAVDRFDVDKGCHFISYAVWWIRQAILKAICEKARMIRLPSNRTNELVQIERTRMMVQERHNAEGEIREIASMLDMDQAHVEDIVNIAREMVSLETPVSTGRESSTVGDFIEDERYPAPEQKLIQGALEKDIESVLGTLNKKEAAIIRSRYGLGKKAPMSLKEIGARYNLSKERIRQIENMAITRLQHPARRERLETYVA
jgi:RNA polymerase primary sigma factor